MDLHQLKYLGVWVMAEDAKCRVPQGGKLAPGELANAEMRMTIAAFEWAGAACMRQNSGILLVIIPASVCQ